MDPVVQPLCGPCGLTSTWTQWSNLYVVDLGCGSDDGPAHHAGEDVVGEVGAGVPAFYETLPQKVRVRFGGSFHFDLGPDPDPQIHLVK